jgi:Protein of unknown function (DUF1194)
MIRVCAMLLFLLAARAPAFVGPAAAEGNVPVDLALILAVDCSGSVNGREFKLQMEGIAAAFRDPEVIAAVTAGRHRRIAVNILLWADPDEQKFTSGWHVVGSEAEALAFAETARKFDLRVGGGTGLGIALGYGISILSNLDFPATRKTIDVSGDGQDGYELREPRFRMPQARAMRAKSDVVINGLAISNDDPGLLAYYRETVIGGPGSFAMEARTYEDFAEAMRRKLLREILPDVALNQ